MKELTVIFYLFAFVGCLKISDVPKEDPSSVNQVKTSIKTDVDTVTYVGLAEPNHYQVHIPIPPGTQAVRRYPKDQPSLMIELAMNGDPILQDDQVTAGASYIYEFGSLQNNAFIMLARYEALIPQDKFIENEWKLDADEKCQGFKRIFLAVNGSITTNGHDLEIQTEEIISNNATIRTFQPGATASPGVKGRSGGQIRVYAHSLKGLLSFELRGEKGGPGEDGKKTVEILSKNDPVVNGKKGAAGGDSGSAWVALEESPQYLPAHQIIKGEGGAGGHAGEATDHIDTAIGGLVPGIPIFVNFSGVEGPSGDAGGEGEFYFTVQEALPFDSKK